MDIEIILIEVFYLKEIVEEEEKNLTLAEKCPLLQFDDLGDNRGKLIVVEGNQTIPFDIKRVFYIYGSDDSIIRGQHANRDSEFVLINVSGQSKVRITDGNEELIVELNKPKTGVYIPRMIWKDMYDFSSDSVLLVLASTHYDGQEYIRDYETYLNELKRKPSVSLCIPTNGVSEWIFPVLDSIYEQGVSNDKFEVVITDNGDNNDFKHKIKDYLSKYDNIKYAETDAEPFRNEIESYKRSKGDLIKFVNHRTKLVPGTLDKLIKIVSDYGDTRPIIYFSNGFLNIPQKIQEYDAFDSFVDSLSYLSSWSTGMTIWREDFNNLPEHTDEYNELFPHTTVLFKERKRGKYIIDDSVIFDEIDTGNKPKGNYDLFYAFGVEFPWIISTLHRDGDISANTCRNVLDANLGFVSELYYRYILRKIYCSYDLSGLEKMYGIFYSRNDIKKSVYKVLVKKVKRKVKKLIS